MKSPFCVLTLAFLAFCQSDRGTITGAIVDPSGSVIPNATIEARNTGTDIRYRTGNYTLSQLPAGPYELSISAVGFKHYVRSVVLIQVAQTLRIGTSPRLASAPQPSGCDAPLCGRCG